MAAAIYTPEEAAKSNFQMTNRNVPQLPASSTVQIKNKFLMDLNSFMCGTDPHIPTH